MKNYVICTSVWIAGSLVLLIFLAMLFSGIFDTSLMTQIQKLDENLGDRYIYYFLFLALIGTSIQSLFIKSNFFGSLAVASFVVGLITSILVPVTGPWFNSLIFDEPIPKTIIDWELIYAITPLLFIFCSIIAGIGFAATQDK